MTTHLDFFIQNLELSESLLDSLRNQICLIDTAGIIRFVNQEWIRFAESNGGSLTNYGIGVSYLKQCKGDLYYTRACGRF